MKSVLLPCVMFAGLMAVSEAKYPSMCATAKSIAGGCAPRSASLASKCMTCLGQTDREHHADSIGVSSALNTCRSLHTAPACVLVWFEAQSSNNYQVLSCVGGTTEQLPMVVCKHRYLSMT